MFRETLTHLRRGLPTIAVAGALIVVSATSGATAALVITGKQIKDNTVSTKDIKNGTLTAKDVKNGSLTTADLKGSTVTDLRGATGPAGPAGAPGISGYQIITAAANIPANDAGQVVGACPAGKRVLSAAAELTGAYTGTAVDLDVSATYATAYAENVFGTPDTLVIDVVCAVVS